MKQILLFGAGKSSTALITYLLHNSQEFAWHLTVVDSQLSAAEEKLGGHPNGTAKSFDVNNSDERLAAIQAADIVISLLPPDLHFTVAVDCLRLKKNLLTASYTDSRTSAMAVDIKAAGLLFLYEMGLDPGIDHMSALELIHRVQAEGANIHSFYSHCGGLVAPESDDNPWHYKISWNPANVVSAGKAGAVYKLNAVIAEEDYSQLWGGQRQVFVPGAGRLSWYPNRDSLRYIPLYGLAGADTFIRTTLRHPQFMQGWKNVVELKLTSGENWVQTDGLSFKDFFGKNIAQFGLADRLNVMNANPDTADFWPAQMGTLGWHDNDSRINNGLCSSADVLQIALEKKLLMQPADKDRVVMTHEIGYTKNGKNFKVSSRLVLDGDDAKHTAMAKTVGLPLGIATRLILQEKLPLTGLHLPVIKEIYEPVLTELKEQGISFTEQTEELA